MHNYEYRFHWTLTHRYRCILLECLNVGSEYAWPSCPWMDEHALFQSLNNKTFILNSAINFNVDYPTFSVVGLCTCFSNETEFWNTKNKIEIKWPETMGWPTRNEWSKSTIQDRFHEGAILFQSHSVVCFSYLDKWNVQYVAYIILQFLWPNLFKSFQDNGAQSYTTLDMLSKCKTIPTTSTFRCSQSFCCGIHTVWVLAIYFWVKIFGDNLYI